MKPPKIFAIALLLCVGPTLVVAQEEPVELDELTVTGVSEALALRAIHVALERKRSDRAEDLDKMVCWYDQITGSRMTQLFCSTNRVLRRTGDFARGQLAETASADAPTGARGVRSWRVDRAELEARLRALGPVDVNEEIVARALSGEPVPDDVPTDEELDRFANAFEEVRQIAADYDPRIAAASGDQRQRLVNESDRLMAERIREAGLSIERYNEVSGMVERFGSIREHVRDRVARR